MFNSYRPILLLFYHLLNSQHAWKSSKFLKYFYGIILCDFKSSHKRNMKKSNITYKVEQPVQ